MKEFIFVMLMMVLCELFPQVAMLLGVVSVIWILFRVASRKAAKPPKQVKSRRGLFSRRSAPSRASRAAGGAFFRSAKNTFDPGETIYPLYH